MQLHPALSSQLQGMRNQAKQNTCICSLLQATGDSSPARWQRTPPSQHNFGVCILITAESHNNNKQLTQIGMHALKDTDPRNRHSASRSRGGSTLGNKLVK